MTFNLKALILIITFNLTTFGLSAQVLWPGDVNNNGVVNYVDWLYIGQLIGEIGPPRDIGEQGIEWEAKNITSIWGTDIFGTGLDYAYADCNGDGVVDGFDFNAIEQNYLNEHGTVIADVAPAADAGVDPAFLLESETSLPFPIGGIMLLQLSLGTDVMPVESFSGIAFTINYNPEIVEDVMYFPADEGDWFDAGTAMIQRDDTVEGRIDFAISMLNMPSSQDLSGVLGGFFIVIEDDVVGMQDPEIETTFTVDNVLMLNEGLQSVPVVNDTITITIFDVPTSNDDLIDEEQIEVYPNPADDFIYLKTDMNIEQVEIYNTLGQAIQSYESNYINPLSLNLSDAPAGVYVLKIHTDQGILTKKILLQ